MGHLVVDVVAGSPRPVWCDRCLASAAVEFDLHGFRGGEFYGPIATWSGCVRCDPHLFAE